MILFSGDWKLFPNCIADINTTNETFLRLSGLYRDMGVKNHAFILQLHDTNLVGVNPHDPDLSIEMMARIAVECKINPFYFFREVARVPGNSSPDPVRFRANRGNMALYWLFWNHIMTMLIQIRQTGKSVSSDILNTYLMNVRCASTQINLLTKDETLRAANLARLKEIEGCLPAFMIRRGRFDLSNTEELTVKALKNTYKGHLPSRSPKQALAVGRGLTSPIFQFDEAAFLPNVGITLPAALAAGVAARDSARNANSPYGTILTTTAGKKDDRDGKYIYEMLCEAAPWSEAFFDAKDREELELIIRKSSRKSADSKGGRGVLRVNCTFNHKQLGYTDEWLMNALEETNAVGEAADRDFFNKWTAGSMSSPLSVELADLIKDSIETEFRAEISPVYGYVIRWYLPEDEIKRRSFTTKFIVSLDSSDMAGGDDTAMVVRDIATGEVLGAGNFNEANIMTFCEWLLTFIVEHPNVLLVVERRSTGSSILDYLIMMLVAKGLDPFKLIYNKVVNDRDEFPERFDEINKAMYLRDPAVYVKYKKLFGFATSGTGANSRNELYGNTLLLAAKYTGGQVKDRTIADQILGLVIRNGRVDHQEGGHDDSCISWLLGYWFMTKAKNLDYYGIDSRQILSKNKARNNRETVLDEYEAKEQEWFREEVTYLSEELKKERDSFVARKLEIRLRQIASMIKTGENEIFSVDDLIKNLNEQRRISAAAAQNKYFGGAGYGGYNSPYMMR